jgi:rare lipoprotein A
MAVIAVAGVLGACAETQLVLDTVKQIKLQWSDPDQSQGRYKIGDPYKIDGVYYYPVVDYGYVETGIASWYGPDFHGRSTANGETYDMNALTAAHRTLPMPSMVRVVNLDNGRSIALRINDRGPFARGRIIDLSRRAAQLLGFRYRGTARVRVEIMADESRRQATLARRGDTTGEQRIAPAPELRKIVVAELTPPATPPPARNANAAPPPARNANAARAAPKVALPDETAASLIELALDLEPVRATALYIQAGAFVRYANAARLRARLAMLAPARVTEARVGTEMYFRVRLGPFQNLGKADLALAKVAASGYPRARLIVD